MITTVLKVMTIPAATLAAAIALGGLLSPTAARAGGYCSVDDDYMWNCGFSTMEQCKSTVSGMNGDCTTNPFVKDDSVAKINRSAYAYSPRQIHFGSLAVKKNQ